MGKYAVVLEKAAPQVDLAARVPAPAGESRASGHRAYAELAAKLFQAPAASRVVAFASVNRGEGVTRTVRSLAAELVRSGKTVTTLDGALRRSHIPGMGVPDDGFEIQPSILGAPRAAGPETASTLIAGLRERYDCILIDCGSLESSVDILRLAPLSDGVVVVVEAGRTGKVQIDRAARVVREAKGTLLGCVLNRRRYPIPDWLYRLL